STQSPPNPLPLESPAHRRTVTKRGANRAAERKPIMSDFIQFKTNQGAIWLRPSAIIGVARETTSTTAMRLVDGKVYSVAGSPKDVLEALGASNSSQTA